jgi:acyl-CoA thioesterase-1
MRLSLVRRHFIASTLLLAGAGSWLPAAQAATPPARTVMVLGDSLSAEYGLKRGTGWVALLEQRLGSEKISAKIVNASISGETTSGGRSRLPALLASVQPTHVLIELGANDALRGLPLAMTETNLDELVSACQKAGARVLLIGIQVPPNYGPDYSRKFAAVFDKVSRSRHVPLVPFLLRGVADGPQAAQLFQADRIHPKEEAHPTILDNVWPDVRKLLQ